MTKHKKVQNGKFWNILEYSDTLYMKSQRINETLLKIILKSFHLFLSLQTTTTIIKVLCEQTRELTIDFLDYV